MKAAVVEASVPVAAKKPAALRTTALDLAPLLLPYKRHGRLTLRVERVPQLARLSAGRNNGDGTWSLALDELDGLTYQYPNILKPHPLALRIMAFDGSDVSTLKVLDYSISSDAADGGPSNGRAASEPAAAVAAAHESLQNELTKLREILAAREAEQAALQQETESARAQVAQVQAELAALRADKAEGDRHLSTASAEAALALERARQTWQAEQAAYLDEMEKRADQHLEQTRETWRQETRGELAKAEAQWKTDEAARFAAAEAALRNQSAAALGDLAQQCARQEAELAAARTAEQNAQELAPLRKELENTQATLAQRERDLAQQRAEADKARLDMQRESARALAEVAERCVLLEKELAQQRAKVEAGLPAAANEIALSRLSESLAEAQTALKQREQEMTRRLAEAEQVHRRAQQASDEALASAKAAWKEEEASRLAAAQTQAREESAAALAQLTGRCEAAEQASAQACKQNQAAAARRDDAYVAGLRAELAGLQKTLVAREAELARARAGIEQSRILHSSPPELPRQNPAWKPLEPEEPQRPRGSSSLLREGVIVMVLAAAAILFYPRLVSLLPENWQYDLYTLTQSHEPRVANATTGTAPVMKIAAAKAQTAVLTRGANVRAAPSGSAAVISSLPHGTHVTVIDQHGNWTLVETAAASGQPARGWVYSAFLTGTH
ncbi:MAG TPA: SH3 domain-containing protein [Rhizomicrobium sp.]|nr:SH3 domain-containing protein [Rhizomicrobium sp.]